jgi:hypothetical protein
MAEMITELYNSPPIIDEMSTNSLSVAGLGEMQNKGVEISQQNLRGQSSTNITEIPNNYSKFRYHKSAH